MKRSLSLILLVFLFATTSSAQDLLNLVEDKNSNEKVENAFKSHRVINSQSIEMLPKGALDFRILHRFGNVDLGAKELFGLDQGSMRLGFDYGATQNLMLGLGRSNSHKEYDGYLKYRFLWQETGKKGMPVSLLAVAGMVVNSETNPYAGYKVSPTFTNRSSYYFQIIVGRKFSSKLTAQLAPIFLHQNVVANTLTPNNLYGLEFGGRYKLNNRLALVWDYTPLFNRFPSKMYAYPLSLGIDIDTGGHVFQLHFTNAVGMNERSLLASENGNWMRAGFKLGFNISRVFQLTKN